MDNLRNEVIAAHLRYDVVAEELRVRAFAQIIAKVLFLSPTPLSRGAICEGVEQLAGGQPGTEDIEDALTYLQKQRVVRRRGPRKWGLRQRQRTAFDTQLAERRSQVTATLERHFPTDLPDQDLRRWFDEVAVEFFVNFGDRWVASVAKRTPVSPALHPDVAGMAQRVARQFGWDDRGVELGEGFVAFLRSTNRQDNDLVFSLGLAMFASRLVCAGIGPDPLSVGEFRHSLLLLDTNVLLGVQLEEQVSSETLGALGRALTAIGARVAYVHETKREFLARVDAWSAATLDALQHYGPEVVAGSKDSHVRTARRRGCFLSNDYARYYGELARLPNSLEGEIEVEFIDTADIAAAADAGKADTALVRKIQHHWNELRGFPKHLPVAQHDAALTNVARSLRAKGQNVWIITNDRTMQDLALRWSGADEAPLWISVDAVVQILALDRASTNVDAVEFAPLLASLIGHEVEFRGGDFTVEDLRYLHEVHEGASELPDSEVKSIARQIHKARMSGVPRNHGGLRLTVERLYQKARLQMHDELDESRRKVSHQVAAKEAAIRDRDAAKGREDAALGALVTDVQQGLIRTARIRLAWRTLAFGCASLLTLWAASLGIEYVASQTVSWDGLGWVYNLGAVAAITAVNAG